MEFAQQIFGPFDFVARVGRARLDYRSQTDAVLAVPNQLDEVNSFGGGIGYHIGRSLRLGFNADHDSTSSAGPDTEDDNRYVRRFSHLRILSAVLKSPTESPFLSPHRRPQLQGQLLECRYALHLI